LICSVNNQFLINFNILLFVRIKYVLYQKKYNKNNINTKNTPIVVNIIILWIEKTYIKIHIKNNNHTTIKIFDNLFHKYDRICSLDSKRILSFFACQGNFFSINIILIL